MSDAGDETRSMSPPVGRMSSFVSAVPFGRVLRAVIAIVLAAATVTSGKLRPWTRSHVGDARAAVLLDGWFRLRRSVTHERHDH